MRIKKILVILVVILFIVKSPIIAYADSVPGTVTVSGGSIGSGGVEGNSNILKGSALTVLMATLASAGITIKVAQDDYERGVGAFSYLGNKFNEWENQSAQGWSNYEALNETKVGQNGELYVSENGGSVIQKFLNWLKANDEISEMPTNDGSTGQYGTFYGTRWDNTNLHYFTTNINCNYAVWRYSAGDQPYIFTFNKENYSFTAYKNYSANGFTPQHANNWYWVANAESVLQCSNINGLLDITTLGYYGIYGVRDFLNQLHETEAPDINIQNTGFYGESADIPQLVDESGNGKILTVQPGLIGQVQDAYTGSNDTTIGIQDYLDALRDLYGQQALPQDITDLPDISINGEDATTGTKEEVAAIDRDIPIYPGITIPSDPDSITWPDVPPIALPIADPDVPADPTVSIPAMTVDLTKIFPFCIPWDLYNLLSKFNADPVTPTVTINWGNILGSIGVNYTTTLDLHDYDDLALILRTMETVAFVIGLAVATRNIFTQS